MTQPPDRRLVTEAALDDALDAFVSGVESVNGETGAVSLSAADVGAQPAGSYAPAIHTHTATQLSDSTATGRAMITAADAAAARSAIGAGTSSLTLGTTSSTAKAGDYAPPAATTSTPGIVELATNTETTTGTDSTRAVTPATLKLVTDDLVKSVNGEAPDEAGNVDLASRGDVVYVWDTDTSAYILAPGQTDDGVSPRAYRGGASGAPEAQVGYVARSGDWQIVA